MASDFSVAVALTLKNEGGFVDNPADPGGATNMGVTQKDYPSINIRDLTVAQAEAFYQEKFWNALYSQIENQSVANKLFDLGVLFGIGTAVKILQEVLAPHFPDVKPDGGFGPVTLAAVNQSDAASLLVAYKTGMVARVIQVASNNPAERIFVSGWIRRINS